MTDTVIAKMMEFTELEKQMRATILAFRRVLPYLESHPLREEISTEIEEIQNLVWRIK